MTLRKSSRTVSRETLPAGTGTDWTVEQTEPFIGQQVRVSYNGSGGDKRSIVGKLIAMGKRDTRSKFVPDLILTNNGGTHIIGMAKVSLISTMGEADAAEPMWNIGAVQLAQTGYMEWRRAVACEPFWSELTEEAKAGFVAFAASVRESVLEMT